MAINSLRILTSEEVARAISMPEAIGLMREAFADLSSGRAIAPQRLRLDMPEEESVSLIMPAYSSLRKRYAAKIVSLSGRNPAKGLPFIHGLLMVFDSERGIPLGLMNAERVTALRTGAASGLATDLLSRKDATTAVIVGAGTQARTQLEGIATVRKLKKAMVYSPESDQARKFSTEMSQKLGFPVEVARDPSFVSDADIICTATTSKIPVFQDKHVKSGVHINGIGSYRPDTREIPTETIRRSTLVVDSRDACFAEAGDIIIPLNEGTITRDHVHAELGEIVSGRRPSRSSEQEITVFKSVGNAVQDLAVAARVLEVAEKENIGALVSL